MFLKSNSKKVNLGIMIFYCLFTILSFVFLIRYLSGEYLYLIGYLLFLYVLVSVILLIGNIVRKEYGIFKFVSEWAYITFVIYNSFIIVCVLFALLLKNNYFEVSPFIISFILNILLICILLFITYLINQGDSLVCIIYKRWIILVESLFVLIPFFLVQSLLVYNRMTEFNYSFLYLYVVFVVIYIVVNLLLYKKYKTSVIFNVVIVFLSVLNLVNGIVYDDISTRQSLYGNRLYFSNTQTMVIYASSILLLFISCIYFLIKNIRVFDVNIKKQAMLRLIINCIYFLVTIIFYVILIKSMVFIMVE